MDYKILNRRNLKIFIISLLFNLFINILFPTATLFASSNSSVYQELDKIEKSEFEIVLGKITEYSEYDYKNQKWILNHQIVEDGHFTEKQYKDAEKAGEEWMRVEDLVEESENVGISTYALPAILILAIKAVGVIAGTAVVTEITTAFTKWGLSAGCNKFKKYGPIKSFCKANDYL